MRELKFRAWDNLNKKMYYNPFNGKVGNINDIFINNRDWEYMQFTGLHDNNDGEIYEGDILGDKDRWFKPIVSYSIKKGGYIIKNLSPEILLLEYISENPGLQIIGNVYETINEVL